MLYKRAFPKYKQGKSKPKMAYIIIDAEADGPIPGDYSMIEFGTFHSI